MNCSYIFAKGKKKGQQCEKNVYNHTTNYCIAHSNYFNKRETSNEVKRDDTMIDNDVVISDNELHDDNELLLHKDGDCNELNKKIYKLEKKLENIMKILKYKFNMNLCIECGCEVGQYNKMCEDCLFMRYTLN